MSDPDPDYVRAVREEAASVDIPVRLPRPRRRDRFSPVLVSVVKNESAHLADFLQHHRDRGVEQFVIIDNGSSDDSVAYLETQEDVFVTVTDRPFHWRNKQGWITHVIRRIGTHRWFLVLDADERLVYPGDHRFSLSDFTAQMEAERLWRIRGLLVDLYDAGPLLHPRRGEHKLFDSDGYERRKTRTMWSVTGGPRHRALSSPGFDLRPEMSKYPLFRVAEGELMPNPHHLWPPGANFKSACRLGILHHKFDENLLSKIEQAIGGNHYWNDSFEYRAYRAALTANPELSLEYEGSLPYRCPGDLVASGLVESVDWQAHRWRRCALRARDRLSPLSAWARRQER